MGNKTFTTVTSPFARLLSCVSRRVSINDLWYFEPPKRFPFAEATPSEGPPVLRPGPEVFSSPYTTRQ